MGRGEEKINMFKNLVIYSTLGIGTSTGLFFLGRYFYKKSIKSKTDKKSLEEGNPATFARQLKMAFDNDNWMGWGTNVPQVYEVFKAIPSKSSYEKVQAAYFNLYGKNLNSDLESELSSDEYNEVIRMLSSKKGR